MSQGVVVRRRREGVAGWVAGEEEDRDEEKDGDEEKEGDGDEEDNGDEEEDNCEFQ